MEGIASFDLILRIELVSPRLPSQSEDRRFSSK
jgi:hypothetical protein